MKSDLEKDGFGVASQITPTLNLHQDFHVVVVRQGNGLLALPSGKDGRQPGEDWRSGHEEPCQYLNMHKEQSKNCHSCCMDNIHKTFSTKVIINNLKNNMIN